MSIKINFDHTGGEQLVQASGSILDICAEISFAISGIYGGLKKRDEHLADGFRVLLLMGLNDPDGPVCSGEVRMTEGATAVCAILPND